MLSGFGIIIAKTAQCRTRKQRHGQSGHGAVYTFSASRYHLKNKHPFWILSESGCITDLIICCVQVLSPCYKRNCCLVAPVDTADRTHLPCCWFLITYLTTAIVTQRLIHTELQEKESTNVCLVPLGTIYIVVIVSWRIIFPKKIYKCQNFFLLAYAFA